MKTYLVTGAAGFIGSNFVKYILGKYGDNIEIIILDALTYAGNLASIKNELERPNVTFVRGDVGDRELVQGIMRDYDVDYIVNFAAESHVDRSITNPRLFLETNILGTQNMLDCAREAWFTGKDAQGRNTYAPGKKYLQISTDEVYGSLSKDFDEPHELEVSDDVREVIQGRTDLKTYGTRFFTEETPLAPRSPYSASKTSADLITMAYHETYGLPVNITRCSNNYGPYHFPEKLIPLIIKNILEGKKLPVYYNIGGFNEESNINIVKQVIAIIARIMRDEPEYQQLLKCDLSVINDGLIEFVTDRPGHDMRYAIDPTKIARELGWYPETPFTEGIEKTIRWNLDNQPWVQSVTSGDYQKYYEEMYGNR